MQNDLAGIQERIERLPERFVSAIDKLYGERMEEFLVEFAEAGEESAFWGAECGTLRAENASLRAAVESLRKESHAPAEQLQVLQDECARSKQETESLRAQLQLQVQNGDALEARYDGKLQEIQARVLELSGEVREKELVAATAREDAVKLREESAALKQELERTKQELSGLSNTSQLLERTRAENEEMRQRIMEQEAQIRSFQESLESSQNERAAVKEESQKLKQSLEKSLAALKETHTAVEEKARLERLLAEKNAEAERLKEQIAQSEKQTPGKPAHKKARSSSPQVETSALETQGNDPLALSVSALKQGPLLPFPEPLFGRLGAADQGDLRHAVFLLLNQNYCLSNLLAQQFQTSGGIVAAFHAGFDSQDQRKFNAKLLTALENFRDVFLEKNPIQALFDRICGQLQAGGQGNGARQNQLQSLPQEAEIKLLRKKLQIEAAALPMAEELTQSKHALAVVYYQSLCGVYEQIVKGGVREFVSFQSASSGVPGIRGIAAAPGQQGTSGTAPLNLQIAQSLAAGIEAAMGLLSKRATLEELRDGLQRLSSLPPNKVQFRKSCAFQEELRSVLKGLVLDFSAEKRQSMARREQEAEVLYLRGAVGDLQGVVVELLKCLGSENNAGNLHGMIRALQEEKEGISVQLAESRAKEAQVRGLCQELQRALDGELKTLKGTFQTIYTALDCSKLQKLQQIVEKQQAIIQRQQADLGALLTKEKAQDADAQTDFTSDAIREGEKAMAAALDLAEKLRLERERAEGMRRGAEGFRDVARGAAGQILGLKEHASELAAKTSGALSRMQAASSRMEGAAKALGNVFVRQSVLVRRQNEFLAMREAMRFETSQTQTDCSALSAQTKETTTEPEPSRVNFAVQLESPPREDTGVQAEAACQQCEKMIAVAVSERHMRGDLEKARDKLEAELEAAQKAKEALEKQTAEGAQAQQHLKRAKERDLKQMRQLEALQTKMAALQKEAEEAKAVAQKAAQDQGDATQKNKDLCQKLFQQQQKVQGLEQAVKENAAAAEELPQLRKQAARLAKELAQARRLMQEQNATAEELRRQLELKAEEAKAGTKQRGKGKALALGNQQISSILTDEDIQAIYDL